MNQANQVTQSDRVFKYVECETIFDTDNSRLFIGRLWICEIVKWEKVGDFQISTTKSGVRFMTRIPIFI